MTNDHDDDADWLRGHGHSLPPGRCSVLLFKTKEPFSRPRWLDVLVPCCLSDQMRRRDDALELYRAAEVHDEAHFQARRAQVVRHLCAVCQVDGFGHFGLAVGQMPPIRAIAASHCWRRRLAGAVVTSVHDPKMRVSSNRVSIDPSRGGADSQPRPKRPASLRQQMNHRGRGGLGDYSVSNEH